MPEIVTVDAWAFAGRRIGDVGWNAVAMTEAREVFRAGIVLIPGFSLMAFASTV